MIQVNDNTISGTTNDLLKIRDQINYTLSESQNTDWYYNELLIKVINKNLKGGGILDI